MDELINRYEKLLYRIINYAGKGAKLTNADLEAICLQEKFNAKQKSILYDFLRNYGIDIENIDQYNDSEDLPVRSNTTVYLQAISTKNLLTAQEEYELGRRVQNGDMAARDQLIVSNLRYVVTIAKRYAAAANMDLDDLIQEGNIGLATAAIKYNPDLGYRFTTYATWWIRQAITRAIANTNRLIRFPIHLHDSVLKYRQLKEQIQSERGNIKQEEVKELIFEQMNLSPQAFAWVEKAAEQLAEPVSLNTPVGEDMDSQLEDFMISPEATTEEAIISSTLKELIAGILEQLSPREKEILELRFGLNGNREHTLEECGKIFHLTRERIRQIEDKALKKMRKKKIEQQLKDFLYN